MIAHASVRIANLMQELQLLREIVLIVLGHVEQWGRQQAAVPERHVVVVS